MEKLALVLFVGLAAADISIQTFLGAACGGLPTIENTVNAANSNSSNCLSAGTYQAVAVSQADPSFQCNLYSDTACQSFIETVNTAGVCTIVTGQGLTCFTSTEPFVAPPPPPPQSTAVVSIGKTLITVDQGGASLVEAGVSTSCGATVCDPNTPFTKPFVHLQKSCTLSVTMNGNYDNTDQRDYMSNLMQAAVGLTDTNGRLDLTGSAADNDMILDTISFSSVVLQDQNGDNQANIDYSVVVDCAPTSGADCSSLGDVITQAVLGAIPAVGSILAGIFQIAICSSGS